MSREITFRAWDGQNGRMLYFGIEDIWENGNGLSEEDQREMKFMQFTGLYDKNGTMIFEGDIIQYVSEETVGERRVSRGRRGYDTYSVKGNIKIQGVVQWEHFKTGIMSVIPMFVIRTGQDVRYKTYFYTEKNSDLPASTVSQLTKPLYDGSYEYQVVGNIYADPELLEVEP